MWFCVNFCDRDVLKLYVKGYFVNDEFKCNMVRVLSVLRLEIVYNVYGVYIYE